MLWTLFECARASPEEDSSSVRQERAECEDDAALRSRWAACFEASLGRTRPARVVAVDALPRGATGRTRSNVQRNYLIFESG